MIPWTQFLKKWVVIVCRAKKFIFPIDTTIHLLSYCIFGNNRIIAEALNDFRLEAIDHSCYHIAHLEYICHMIKKKAE